MEAFNKLMLVSNLWPLEFEELKSSFLLMQQGLFLIHVDHIIAIIWAQVFEMLWCLGA